MCTSNGDHSKIHIAFHPKLDGSVLALMSKYEYSVRSGSSGTKTGNNQIQGNHGTESGNRDLTQGGMPTLLCSRWRSLSVWSTVFKRESLKTWQIAPSDQASHSLRKVLVLRGVSLNADDDGWYLYE